MADQEARFSPLAAAGDGLLLLCALVGLSGSFLSLYGDGRLGGLMANHATPLDQCAAWTGSFLFLAAVFALLSLAAWSLPRFWGAAAGGLAALWGAAAFLNRDSVVQGAGLTVRSISVLFSRRVSWGRVFQYDPNLTQVQEGACARLFLILTLALLALVLGWAVVRARRWWLVALLTLPPLLPGLLADLYPNWPAFLALAVCWCAMLLTDLCKWAAPGRRGALTLAVLPCVAGVLAAITFAFPREGYTRPAWALKAQGELADLASRAADCFSRFDGPFRSTVTYVGAAEEADLARAGPLRYSGRTVLRVESDYAGRLYLRGSSLAVYEDGVWKDLPEGTYERRTPDAAKPPVSPLLFPALSGRLGEAYTATVDNVGAVGSCVYAPYFPTAQDLVEGGMLPVEDTCLARRSGQWSHTIEFAGADLSRGGSAATGDYRRYVYAHYLDVPEECRKALTRMCMDHGVYGATLDGGASCDPVAAAREIAALLDGLCEYDPETPAAPAGEDPVLYFLGESRRGYCMHYASATALMLRSLGIPARYASGFTAVPQPGRRVDVPDRAAHAWVEVWVDGFGWYPVEVTPAAAFDWYREGIIGPADLPSAPAAESESPGPTPTPSETPGPSGAPSPPVQGGTGDSGPSDGPGPAALPAALKALCAALCAAALVWLGQFLPKRYRAKRLSGPDRNRAALDAYNYLRRMGRWGGRVDGRAVELAQKAKFSRHTLTGAELDELRLRVDQERERLWVILGPAGRLAFRYLWGMPKRPGPERPPENPG